MLHHSTEYRLNGGAWTEITPDEVAGSGKTFTISGLASGSYNVEMRLTPLVGGGPSVVSNSFTLNVIAGSYVAQIQAVQSESASGVLQFVASSSQAQNKDTEQGSGLLLFIGSVAQVQNIQSESGSTSSNISGSISESQLVQAESSSGIQTFTGSIAQSQNTQTNAATSAETFAGSVAVSQNKQTEVIVSYETFAGTIAESQQKQAESSTSVETFSASVAETQNAQSESISGSSAAIVAITGTIAQSQTKQNENVSSVLYAGPLNAITNVNGTFTELGDGNSEYNVQTMNVIWQSGTVSLDYNINSIDPDSYAYVQLKIDGSEVALVETYEQGAKEGTLTYTIPTEKVGHSGSISIQADANYADVFAHNFIIPAVAV